MNKKISKILTYSVFNIITVTLALFVYVLLNLPAQSYYQAKVTLFLIPIIIGVTIANMFLYIIRIINSFRKNSSLAIIDLAFSLFIVWFMFAIFYPWARYTIHFPPPSGVCWRENVIFDVKSYLTGFARNNDGMAPQTDNWRELLIEKKYDFKNVIETWDKSFDSSIVMNENLKGINLKKIDKPIVFLFEGPKGCSFGNEKTFRQLLEKKGYAYVVLTNGLSGRIRLKDGKAESLFGGLNNQDLPLVWELKPQN